MISFLKKTAISPAGKSVLILTFLFSIVGLFEFLPVVDHARAMFPESLDAGYDCQDVLRSRPWYGRINPWLWFWLVSTPAVVFSADLDTPAWQRAGRTIFIIALSYIVVNLGTHLAMDIKNAPFHGEGITHVNGIRVTSDEDEFKFHCYDIAGGARHVGAFYFGWVPALVYTGWWEIIWYQYHKRKTRLIDKSFRRDWISRAVAFLSAAATTVFTGIVLGYWMTTL